MALKSIPIMLATIWSSVCFNPEVVAKNSDDFRCSAPANYYSQHERDFYEPVRVSGLLAVARETPSNEWNATVGMKFEDDRKDGILVRFSKKHANSKSYSIEIIITDNQVQKVDDIGTIVIENYTKFDFSIDKNGIVRLLAGEIDAMTYAGTKPAGKIVFGCSSGEFDFINIKYEPFKLR